MQVAPDRAPSVDFTSPDGNLFATLDRQLDFAFRGRDDHGIGEAAIAYRINKTAEAKVELPAPASDAKEQKINWDYREALPDLAIGDTVTFAIELADRYPGKDGPHRARSDARRVQFLSKKDYLAQIEKQKRRLLSRIRTIYREERGVHEIIRNLDMAPWLLIAMMMFIVFILGAFLDWTGIVLLSFPIFLPIVQEMDVSLLWFVVLMSVVLQTSFLTPPFGYALFYLRAIAPREVKTSHIIVGVLPFIGLILMMCVAIALFPQLVTWLPETLYTK